MNALVAAACVIDAFIGDPPTWPHPVRIVGTAVTHGERLLRRRFPATPMAERIAGSILAGSLIACTFFTTARAQSFARRYAPRYAFAANAIAAASTVALRDLLAHVARIEQSLTRQDIDAARKHLSYIVGRDTDALDEHAIVAAALESLSESFCDGIVAPLFFLTYGGLPWAMTYKTVNTLDSMIGHREAPYTTFGSFAARCDDIMNLVPARLSALLIACMAPLMQGSLSQTLRGIAHDASKHPSPNAGYPEVAMAYALNVRLGGTVSYQGVPDARPLMNECARKPNLHDLRDAMQLVIIATAGFAALAALATHERP